MTVVKKVASTLDALHLQIGDALVLVDIQNDFLPGGALGIPDADQILPPANELIERFSAAGLPIFATRDWHPADHSSFASEGGPWPVHCVAGTAGADFSPSLDLPDSTVIISKGVQRQGPGYSGFDGTDLDQMLRAANVRRLFIAGLATDYCVGATAEDALAKGFEVVLVTDAVRGVDPAHAEARIEKLCSQGAQRR